MIADSQEVTSRKESKEFLRDDETVITEVDPSQGSYNDQIDEKEYKQLKNFLLQS